MNFKNPDELAKYFKSYAYPVDVEKYLEQQARLLGELLQEEVDNYYSSYQPAEYQRTFNFKNSIRVSPVSVGKSGNSYSFSVNINFDEEMATHPSMFNGEDGFVPFLLNEGWQWRERIGPYRLAYYEGFHFIQRAITRFRRSGNNMNISIKVVAHHNGVAIDGLDGDY